MKTLWQRMCVTSAAAGLALLATVAWACSCLPYPEDPRLAVEQAWSQSDAVLSGVVANQQPAGGESGGMEVTLDVARRWKGPQGPQVKIHTSDSSASCGYGFETGAQYLVFASRDEQNGRYSTGLCSLTRPLEEARALVRALDARVESK